MTEYQMMFEYRDGAVVCPGPGWQRGVLRTDAGLELSVWFRPAPDMMPRADVEAALQRCYDRDDSVVAEMIAEWLGIGLREEP